MLCTLLCAGETKEQVLSALKDAKEAGVDVVTFGQYMRPTKKHMAVSEYITPQAFESWQKVGEQMGFKYMLFITF